MAFPSFFYSHNAQKWDLPVLARFAVVHSAWHIAHGPQQRNSGGRRVNLVSKEKGTKYSYILLVHKHLTILWEMFTFRGKCEQMFSWETWGQPFCLRPLIAGVGSCWSSRLWVHEQAAAEGMSELCSFWHVWVAFIPWVSRDSNKKLLQNTKIASIFRGKLPNLATSSCLSFH